jgi:hypothetical protein
MIPLVETIVGAVWKLFTFWYQNIRKERRERAAADAEQKKAIYAGLRGLLPPFYYPLRLGRFTQYIGTDPGRDKPLEFPISAWQEDSAHPREKVFERYKEDRLFEQWIGTPGVYLVLGEPGSGKTTLLEEWRDRSREYTSKVADTVWSPFRDYSAAALTRRSKRKSRKTLDLFDGWDEADVDVRAAFSEIVPTLKGVVVISCRTAVYNHEFDKLLTMNAPYYLMGIDKIEQKTFLKNLAEHWRTSNQTGLINLGFRQASYAWATDLWCGIHKKKTFSKLSGSPLLLTLLAFMHPPRTERHAELPESKLDFYEKAFYWLCKNRINLDEHPNFLSEAKGLLLAVVVKAQLKADIPHEIFSDAHKTFKAQRAESQSSLRDLLSKLKQSGLIKHEVVSNTYNFLHLTFQEWLLAEALKTQLGLLNAVERHWLRPEYSEVLSLLWEIRDIDPDERILTTQYLVGQGCVDISKDKPAVRSGLQMVLQLWALSGLSLKHHYPTVFEELSAKLPKSSKRRLMAARFSLPDELLDLFAKDEFSLVRRNVASNTNTPASLLETLSKDDDDWVRGAVASNANTPAAVLETLAKDEDSSVRGYLAYNANTPRELLETLAQNEDSSVRKSIAYSSNTPTDLLETLAKDEDFFVRANVASNTSTCSSLRG